MRVASAKNGVRTCVCACPHTNQHTRTRIKKQKRGETHYREGLDPVKVVHQPVGHLRQGGVVARVRPVGQNVGQEVDQPRHAARELVQLGSLVRSERPVPVQEPVAELWEPDEGHRVIQEDLG